MGKEQVQQCKKEEVMKEELQAAWDRPGEVSFKAHGEEDLQFSDGTSWHTGPDWAMGWKITRPVKMWLGNLQSHSYGLLIYSDEPMGREEVFDVVKLLREGFDRDMQVLDQPAWRRFIHSRLPRLDSHIREYAEHLRLCREFGLRLPLLDWIAILSVTKHRRIYKVTASLHDCLLRALRC